VFLSTQLAELSECKITDQGLRCLSRLANLQQLRLDCLTRITDKGVQSLSVCEKLQRLSLRECTKIVGTCFQSMFVQLQLLDVRRCDSFYRVCMQSLLLFENLRSVFLEINYEQMHLNPELLFYWPVSKPFLHTQGSYGPWIKCNSPRTWGYSGNYSGRGHSWME
jgi:hypothetical protein